MLKVYENRLIFVTIGDHAKKEYYTCSVCFEKADEEGQKRLREEI